MQLGTEDTLTGNLEVPQPPQTSEAFKSPTCDISSVTTEIPTLAHTPTLLFGLGPSGNTLPLSTCCLSQITTGEGTFRQHRPTLGTVTVVVLSQLCHASQRRHLLEPLQRCTQNFCRASGLHSY